MPQQTRGRSSSTNQSVQGPRNNADSKQKRPAVCKGQPGIRQDEAEQRVLAGLQRHLLTDAAYVSFKTRVGAEAAVLTERANAELRRVEAQTIEPREAIENLVTAIAKGRTRAALFTALEKVEAHLAALEAKRAEMTLVVVELPRNPPQVYRGQVRRLAASRSHEVALGRASHALRRQIDKVVVTWDQATESHTVDLEGRLAALLELGGARPVQLSSSNHPEVEATTAGLLGLDGGDRLLAEGDDPEDDPDGPRPPSGTGRRQSGASSTTTDRQLRAGATAPSLGSRLLAATGNQDHRTEEQA